ncbi:glycerophosphoryl diester phosphodiesterase membrane domain-containing protein [Gleimia hominis]|uniref:Glycerophosphoryl diester phosphodiesterase membrane domain-containing protein n=1 Tax=Gleimia hominis TaxID=595468 RepID=A0ABU3I958_9ACTO|nr:glycerophosphoryl diester phosphodiesterase membrane domain-containing protein [Gleimia hominis]MDT3766900.1 glycerophosphoryl diester phosphodiesterase membrane domain-containing protein [Gleimia hominis]
MSDANNPWVNPGGPTEEPPRENRDADPLEPGDAATSSGEKTNPATGPEFTGAEEPGAEKMSREGNSEPKEGRANAQMLPQGANSQGNYQQTDTQVSNPWSKPPSSYGWSVVKPGIIPIRPLKLTDFFEAVFSLIRFNPAGTLGLAVLVGIIGALLAGVSSAIVTNTPMPELGEDPQQLILAFIPVGLQSIGSQLLTGLLTLLAIPMLVLVTLAAVRGYKLNLKQVWAGAKPRLLPALGAGIVISIITTTVGLVTIAAVVAAAIFIVASSQIDSIHLVWVIPLLAIVGILIAALLNARFALTMPAVVEEKLSPLKAIFRSWRLSKGNTWRLAGILILTMIAISVVVGVISMPLSIGLGVIVGLANTSAATLSALSAAVTAISYAISFVLTIPIQAGVVTMLYVDQRIRKEGFDMQLLNESQTH